MSDDRIKARLRAAAQGAESIVMPPCTWCGAESVAIVAGTEPPLAACCTHLDDLGSAHPEAAAKGRRACN